MEKEKPKRLPQEMFRSWLRPGRPQTRSNTRQLNEWTVETAVGCNSVIIHKIMEHVGVQDLLNCRLVNSVWTPIATTRLNKLHTPCSSFQYQYIPKCYGGLSELMKCAKNSVKFPCTSFTFRAGDMRSEDAKEFLTLMGSSAKTLTLYAVDNATLCSDMNLTTILSHTPNLETLVFAGCFDTITTRATLALPLLKYIKIDGEVYTSMTEIKLILNGAPHLENIANVWRLNNLEPILTTKKIHTVKSWCPSTFAFPSGFIQLVTATEDQLKLSELVVFIDESNRHNLMEIDAELLWNCFQKVLNQNTVRKLILKRSKYPVNAAFPLNMDNVKELVLMSDSHSEYKHFPHRINLNTTFPRLTTLSFYDPMLCCAVCCADRERENRFPFLDEFADSNGSFPSVTTLNLRDGSTSIRMLRRMKKICPNVQNLEICLKGKIDRKRIVQELCGEWRHLKKLTIDLQQNELKDNLDLAFTGLCPAYIESLNGDLTLTDKQKLRRVEDTRYVLWIGNISGLVQLDVKYDIRCTQQSKDDKLIPFTRTSGLYAFNLMPNLTVNLHCYNGYTESDELQRALQSIKPFAIIRRHRQR